MAIAATTTLWAADVVRVLDEIRLRYPAAAERMRRLRDDADGSARILAHTMEDLQVIRETAVQLECVILSDPLGPDLF